MSIQVPPDSTGKLVDTSTVAGKERQIVQCEGVGAGGTAVPVSAAALPLPAGAATEGTQATRASEATAASLAKESGGNLAAIAAALNEPITRQNEILLAILRELRTLRLGFSRDLPDMPGEAESDIDLTSPM